MSVVKRSVRVPGRYETVRKSLRLERSRRVRKSSGSRADFFKYCDADFEYCDADFEIV